jgi:hypothetical protein
MGWTIILGEAASKLDENAIPTESIWDKGTYNFASEVMHQYDARGTVEEIRAALRQLRDNLERNFSLKDVLPSGGDRLFDTSYRGGSFLED